MDYNTLVYKLGSLHSLLRDLESADLFQGEHTIAYTGTDGVKHMLHVYIDGTSLEMENTTGNHGLSSSTSVLGQDPE